MVCNYHYASLEGQTPGDNTRGKSGRIHSGGGRVRSPGEGQVDLRRESAQYILAKACNYLYASLEGQKPEGNTRGKVRQEEFTLAGTCEATR